MTSKASKGAKASKGPKDLRIESPLSAELDLLVYNLIGCGMRVHSAFGPGLFEKSYDDAFAVELRRRGFKFQRQVPVSICA